MDRTTPANEDTPMLIVSTRNEVSKNRRENRKSMSKDERKVHGTLIQKLTRPHDRAYVTELNAIKDKSTPERAEDMIGFTEDMMDVDP